MDLTPVSFGEVQADLLPKLVKRDTCWFQQKIDGHRVFLTVTDHQVKTFGNDGRPKANQVPEPILAEFRRLPTGSWCFDGELLDRTLWLFDLVAAPSVAFTEPYALRQAILETFFGEWRPRPCVRLVYTARTAREKTALLRLVRDGRGEGVMVKDPDAPYEPGVESSRMVRAKFRSSADVVVTRLHIDDKDNCAFGVYTETGEMIEVGKCHLHGRPIEVGDMIEVEYLYVVTTRLVQPTFKRKRNDKARARCSIGQLHFTDKHTVHMPSAS